MFGDLIHIWSRAASAVREPPAAADVDPDPSPSPSPKTVLHASTLTPHSPKAPPGSSPRIRAATTSSLRRIHVIAAVPVTAASITPELAARFQSVAWSVQGTRRHLTLGSMAPGPPGAATQILGGPTITTRSSVGLSAWIVPSGRGLGTAARWGHPKTVCRSYWCGRRHARPCLGLASTLSQAGPTLPTCRTCLRHVGSSAGEALNRPSPAGHHAACRFLSARMARSDPQPRPGLPGLNLLLAVDLLTDALHRKLEQDRFHAPALPRNRARSPRRLVLGLFFQSGHLNCVSALVGRARMARSLPHRRGRAFHMKRCPTRSVRTRWGICRSSEM